MLFVAMAVLVVKLTGLRFVLFPPLVVIGFEMFGHTAVCPWAKRPMFLPAACFLTAAGGLLFWNLLGVGPVAAGCSIATGMAVLRLFDLHVPPALAVALLPFVMDYADHRLPNLGRNRNNADDAMVSTLPIVLSQVRARVSLVQRSSNPNEHQSYRPGVRDAGRSRRRARDRSTTRARPTTSAVSAVSRNSRTILTVSSRAVCRSGSPRKAVLPLRSRRALLYIHARCILRSGRIIRDRVPSAGWRSNRSHRYSRRRKPNTSARCIRRSSAPSRATVPFAG